MRNKSGKYFKRVANAPADLVMQVKRRVGFNEVDIMGIVWFGKYPLYFEEGSAALGRVSGLSYKNFKKEKLRAPVVHIKIDYHNPLYLDEEFVIETRLVWTEAAKLCTEYKLIKENGELCATGALTQLFVGEKQNTYFVAPKLLEVVKKRWKNGEIKCQA